MLPVNYTIQNLVLRKWRTLITIFGISLAIAVFAGMNAVTRTMTESFKATGHPSEVVVLESGALNMDFSNISRNSLTYVQTLNGVKAINGEPLVSPELYLGTLVQINNHEAEVAVRGVIPLARSVYGQVRLINGTWSKSGKHVVIGQVLSRKFGIGVGDELNMQRENWKVAGIISGNGRVYDQEIWTDLEDLAAVSNRKTYTSYLIQAVDSEAAESIVNTINEGRRFPLLAMPSPAFYKQSSAMASLMAGIGTFISVIIAIGSIFGAMNTMYSSVAARRREFGILGAIGYRPRAILGSLVFESILIALVGCFIGLIMASFLAFVPVDLPYLPIGTVRLGTSQIVAALIMSMVVGLLGGSLPALQAARQRTVDAMK